MTNEVSFECLKPHERDFFVSRISCGYYYIDLNGQKLKFVHPNKRISLLANQVYMDSFNECINKTISEKAILDLIISEFGWNYANEEFLEEYPSLAKDIKIKLFQNMYNPILKMNLKKELKELAKEYSRLYNIKNTFHYMTPHGIADANKWHFIINNCVYNNKREKQKYIFQKSKIVTNLVLSEYLTDSILRNIANNEPWSSIWYASEGKDIFAGKVCDYNSEQIRLISWSKMYQNIRMSNNPPSEDVIEDDDILDGWMAISSMEREKERNIATAEGRITNKKIRGSQEVFVPVSSKEEAKHIQSLNTASNKMKQKEMIEKLKGS